jgi:hypothetical protein
VVGIGCERLFVPDLGLIVVAHPAERVADIVGDVGVLVMAERMQGGDPSLVVAGEDQLAGGAVVAEEFLLRQLLLLLLDHVALLFLLLAVVIGRRVRRVGAHGMDGDRLDAHGGYEQGGGGEKADVAQRLGRGHGETSPVWARTSEYDESCRCEKNNP